MASSVEATVVFIAHSGSRSLAIAKRLKSMLETIFADQHVMPWISDDDIHAGTDWWEEIRARLSKTDFGIFCFTKENQLSPWMAFEAGAISKRAECARIVKYMIDKGIKLGDPYARFQDSEAKNCAATKEGTRRVVEAIAACAKSAIELSAIFKSGGVFDQEWAALEKGLSAVHGIGTGLVPAEDPELVPTVLPQINKISWDIEEASNRPFRRWLRNRGLEVSLKALEELDPRNEGVGFAAYEKLVEAQVNAESPAPNKTILALCGDKGFTTRHQLNDYFAQFYRFAANQRGLGNLPDDRIRVCRIFVEPEKNHLAPEERLEAERRLEEQSTIVEQHRANRNNGVLALTIESGRRPELDKDYSQLNARLDAGFGFLAFHEPGECVVITHEGKAQKLAHLELRNRLMIGEILQLFVGLSKKSREFEAESGGLKQLLERIRQAII
jgi:hypothetical protein